MLLRSKFLKIAMFSLAVFTTSFTTTVEYAQVRDIRDEQGRTEFINLIIYSQEEVAKITADENRLWHICYENVTIRSQGFSQRTFIRIETRRKASCLDKDIEAHNQRVHDLQEFKQKIFNNIAFFVATYDKDYLLARDYNGMSALNHCANKEIYCMLRECGVPFQYDAWAYNYRGEIIVSSVLLTVIAIALYKNDYLTEDAFIQLRKNIESGAITTINGIKEFIDHPLNKSLDAMHACIDGIYYATVFVWNNLWEILDINLELCSN